ncbi:MAG: DUF2095 family protein [Desulfurococcaceae archaeon]
MGEYDIEEFKKKFPWLAKEILEGETEKITLRVKTGLPDPWRGYVPTVVDYIRRCKTVDEAFKVIEYLLRRGELTTEEAEELKRKLESGGIEAFGGRKEDDYYYKQARKYWQMVKAMKRRNSRMTVQEQIEEQSTEP